MEVCPINKCLGCHACYNVCTHHAIEMSEDELGHLYPVIDNAKCVSCSLCRLSCPVNNKPVLVYPSKCFAVALSDESDLLKSASGGAATAMMRTFTQNGGVVYGCSGEDIFNVRHVRIDNVMDVEKLRGSKYVQSYVGDIYQKVKLDLQDCRECFFIGTPCQIAGLKSYLRRDYPNLVTADLVCHGVPSQKMLTENVRNYTSEKDGCKVKISFRRKIGSRSKLNSARIEYGWFMQNQPYSNLNRKFYNDSYMFGFLQCLTFRDCCYTCRYATSARCADITFADFWGLGDDVQFEKGLGVSLCLVNSEKGQKLIEQIRPFAKVVERDIVEAIKGNGQLQRPSRMNSKRTIFKQLYPIYGLKKSIEKTLNIDKFCLLVIKPMIHNARRLIKR